MKNKVAVITGSSRGLGKAIALRLAKEDYKIILNCRKYSDEVRKTKKEIENTGTDVTICLADVSEKNGANKLIKHTLKVYEKIDVLVNNAGIFKKHEKMNDKDRIKFFKIKCNAIEFCSDEAIAAGVKSIINIASIYAIKPTFTSRFVSVLQNAVKTLTEIYAKEYVGKVQVNCIAPGWMNTKMVTSNYPKKILQEVLKKEIPIKRLIQPDEIADVVSFLLRTPLISGQTIVVDGGYTLVH